MAKVHLQKSELAGIIHPHGQLLIDVLMALTSDAYKLTATELTCLSHYRGRMLYFETRPLAVLRCGYRV